MSTDDGKEVSWSREKMLQASMAAAPPERMWQGRRILVLDDGAPRRIYETAALR